MNPIVAPRRPQILWTGCALLLAAVALHPAAASARTLLEAGQVSVWKYLDNGTRPAEAWRGVDFDDTPWKSGAAPLGFGDPGIGTEVGWGDRPEEKFTTTWFRRVFDKPELEPGDRLVISCRVDDGAVIHLNGKEIGRINMPPGPLAAGALAARELADRDEGFYTRLPVPAADLVPGKNVLAVEVYQASAKSGDLFFDLALKALPADVSPLVVRDSARGAMTTFLREHYLGPGVTIPDGFTDGGRHTEFDAHGRPVSHREILLVDRALDKELDRHLAFARSAELRAMPPLERAGRLAAYIDQQMTPRGGRQWEEKTVEQLETEFANRPILLGEWVDQGQAGVCRHRSLLFKILADEAGLQAALVRGNCPRPNAPHAWNEIFPGDGRRVLVDVMHKRNKQDFPEVQSAGVVRHYFRADHAAWYTPQAPMPAPTLAPAP